MLFKNKFEEGEDDLMTYSEKGKGYILPNGPKVHNVNCNEK